MLKSVKSKAEEQFAAIQKKDKQALKEKEKVIAFAQGSPTRVTTERTAIEPFIDEARRG